MGSEAGGYVSQNPILVYQMGRVGSKAVEAALRSTFQGLSLNVPVEHGHYLSNFDVLERRARTDLRDPTLFMADLAAVSGRMRSLLASAGNQKVNIISLVRDPIARNVSTFFFALEQFIPEWEQGNQGQPWTAAELHRIYLSKDSFILTALNWFEEQLEPVFGIDVYATPFATARGYQIYSGPSANLLVIRQEDLDRCVGPAIQEFLGIQHFAVDKVNVGEQLKAGSLYRLFKTRPLPPDYVHSIYNFRLPQHFYTGTELDAFAHTWTGLR